MSTTMEIQRPEDVAPPVSEADERLYTPDEVAEKWSLTPRWVRELCNVGKLRYVLIGERQKRIPESALIEYKREHTVRHETGQEQRHCAVTKNEEALA